MKMTYQHFVRCQCILDRGLGKVGLFQLDSCPQLIHSYDPQMRLKEEEK